MDVSLLLVAVNDMLLEGGTLMYLKQSTTVKYVQLLNCNDKLVYFQTVYLLLHFGFD